MPLTAYQIEMRRSCLGASETPIILGYNPYKSVTPKTIQAQKLYEMKPNKQDASMSLGNIMESPLIEWCVAELRLNRDKKTGCRIIKNQFKKHAQNKIMGATVDALIKYPVRDKKKDEVIEAKTANLVYVHANDDAWGEPNTNQIPKNYNLQCQQQMYVRNLDRVYVPTLIGGKGFNLYIVERNNELIEKMVEIASAWWNKHIVHKEPIDEGENEFENAGATLAAYTRIKPVHERMVEVNYSDVMDWEKAKFYKSLAEKYEKMCKARLMAQMGNGSGAELPDGRTLTNLEYTRNNAASQASVTKYYSLKCNGKPDAAALEEAGLKIENNQLTQIGGK